MVQWPFIKPHGDTGKDQIITVSLITFNFTYEQWIRLWRRKFCFCFVFTTNRNPTNIDINNFLILDIQKFRGRQSWAGVITQRCHQAPRLFLPSCYTILSMWLSTSAMKVSYNTSRHQACIPGWKKLEGQGVGGQKSFLHNTFHFVFFLHAVITIIIYFLIFFY